MKKVKSFLLDNLMIVIDVLYYMYFAVAILVKVLYLQYITDLNINAAEDFWYNVKTMVAAMSIVMIIFAAVIIVFKKKRNGAFFAINVLLSILFLADTLYYRYYQVPISIALIYQLGLVGDITKSAESLFSIKDIIYFIDLPVYFIVLAIKHYLKGKFEIKFIKRRYTAIISIFLICFSAIIFNKAYEKSNTAMYIYDRNNVAKDLSILYYHYYDIKGFVADEFNRRTPISQEDNAIVEAYYNNKWKDDIEKKKYTGIAKDKNLIVLQIEALQEFVIGREINGQEITPFLNSLIKESAYFSNVYNQVAGGNTSDAEFLLNNSLYPISSGAVYFRYPNNKYYSLPGELKEKGYSTFVSHAYKPSFWNRQVFYKANGFDKFYSIDDFNLDEKIGWAVSDESFFKQVVDKTDFSKKTYSFNITLSNHHPYDSFIKMDNLDVGKYSEKMLGWYLKGANYVDSSIKALFELLKEKGIYDNSIIVIYGDHSGIYEDQAGDLYEFLGMEGSGVNWKKLQKVPVIIHVPNSDLSIKVDKVGGQIDIMPTISNLMGVEAPYALGKDLLNIPENEEGYAVLRYSTVITDSYMYLNDSKLYYDMNTGEEIDGKQYEEDVNDKLMELKVSDIIINKDYFSRIK